MPHYNKLLQPLRCPPRGGGRWPGRGAAAQAGAPASAACAGPAGTAPPAAPCSMKRQFQTTYSRCNRLLYTLRNCIEYKVSSTSMVTSTIMEADAVLDTTCTVQFQSLYEASTASNQLLPERAVRDVQQLEAGQAAHSVRDAVERAVQPQGVQSSQLLHPGGTAASGQLFAVRSYGATAACQLQQPDALPLGKKTTKPGHGLACIRLFSCSKATSSALPSQLVLHEHSNYATRGRTR